MLAHRLTTSVTDSHGHKVVGLDASVALELRWYRLPRCGLFMVRPRFPVDLPTSRHSLVLLQLLWLHRPQVGILEAVLTLVDVKEMSPARIRPLAATSFFWEGDADQCKRSDDPLDAMRHTESLHLTCLENG